MATINKTPRNTDFWLNEDIKRNEKMKKTKNSPETATVASLETINSGPGYYNANKFPKKESFNYGRIPFGTGDLQRQQIKGSALQAASLESPGPGAYLKSQRLNQSYDIKEQYFMS